MKAASAGCCIFCDAPADSREHVFPKRLCKRASAVRFPVIPGVFTEGKGTRTRKQHQLEALQVRHVCARCNNGWMNDLETWFEDRLGFLIEKSWPKLGLTMIKAALTEHQRLAHWLMKTAITFSLSAMQGDLPVQFPAAFTKAIKEGKLPDHCWADLAYSRMRTVGGTIGRCFRVINGEYYNPSQFFSEDLSFRFTIQFNHLLLRIARCPDANVTYESWQGELPVRIYPAPTLRIPELFAYDDIMKFEHAVVLETCFGCKGDVR